MHCAAALQGGWCAMPNEVRPGVMQCVPVMFERGCARACMCMHTYACLCQYLCGCVTVPVFMCLCACVCVFVRDSCVIVRVSMRTCICVGSTERLVVNVAFAAAMSTRAYVDGQGYLGCLGTGGYDSLDKAVPVPSLAQTDVTSVAAGW